MVPDQLSEEHELSQTVLDLTQGQCRSSITALGAALGVQRRVWGQRSEIASEKDIFFTWGQWQCRVQHIRYPHRNGKAQSRISDKLMPGQRLLQSFFPAPVATDFAFSCQGLDVPTTSHFPACSFLQRMTPQV